MCSTYQATRCIHHLKTYRWKTHLIKAEMAAHFSQLSTIISFTFYYFSILLPILKKTIWKVYGMNIITQYQYMIISKLYEKLSNTFHYNKLPMSFWEMILEANNTTLVQNARPLAEGIIQSLRNIPRRGQMLLSSRRHGLRVPYTRSTQSSI